VASYQGLIDSLKSEGRGFVLPEREVTEASSCLKAGEEHELPV